MMPCCHAVMLSWCYDVMMSWCPDIMISWWHVVMAWCNVVMMSYCHVVMLSWYNDVMLSCCHVVMLSWCHVVMESWSPNIFCRGVTESAPPPSQIHTYIMLSWSLEMQRCRLQMQRHVDAFGSPNWYHNFEVPDDTGFRWWELIQMLVLKTEWLCILFRWWEWYSTNIVNTVGLGGLVLLVVQSDHDCWKVKVHGSTGHTVHSQHCWFRWNGSDGCAERSW